MPDRFKQLAVRVFGVDPEGKTAEEAGLEGIERLRDILEQHWCAFTLADYDIDDSQIDVNG